MGLRFETTVSSLHPELIRRAVVLLDEADIFLEERSLHDLSRNALVSSKSATKPVMQEQ